MRLEPSPHVKKVKVNALPRLSKVRGSWFLEATDFCHPQARQIHRCIFAPVTSVNAHYYSVLTTPFDMVNAHYVIIDFRAKFFIKIQNQASDTSRSLPSFSSAPFLLRAVPSERLGQVYALPKVVGFLRVLRFPPTGKVDRVG